MSETALLARIITKLQALTQRVDAMPPPPTVAEVVALVPLDEIAARVVVPTAEEVAALVPVADPLPAIEPPTAAEIAALVPVPDPLPAIQPPTAREIAALIPAPPTALAVAALVERGPKGDKPDHRWDGTKLQFEKPDGTWGAKVDLKGPKGKDGISPTGGGGYIVDTSGSGAGIDDDVTALDSTWSSTKIASEIANAASGPGGSGDLHYQHVQGVASDTWAITHNLNKYPSVVVIDSGGDEVEGDLSYDGPNSLTVSFSAPFGGVAYLN